MTKEEASKMIEKIRSGEEPCCCELVRHEIFQNGVNK